MDQRTLSWLHVSDLHFGHGREARHRVDQQIVCSEILRDAGEMVERLGLPDWVFITGDVAFKADKDEYNQAAQWLDKLLQTVKVGKDRVYLVPGNHDVDRGKATADYTSKTLHKNLRANPAELDELLKQPKDLAQIWPKLAAYAQFAQSYAAPPLDPERPFWTVERDTLLGKVVLAGLNTTLLSFDDADNPSNLAMGLMQLEQAVHAQKADTLLLMLQHHPPGWLVDRKKLEAILQSRPHILFCGHVHEQGGLVTLPLHGGGLFQLVAGAGHVDPGSPPEHGYSWGWLSPCGLDYFPRTWNETRHRFVADKNSFEDMDEEGAVAFGPDRLPEALRGWLNPEGQAPKPPRKKPVHRPSSREPAPIPVQETALRDAYLSRLMARCGYVSLAGIDPAAASQKATEAQLQLNAIYTALLTDTPRREAHGRILVDRLRSALEQLDQHRLLVLQGDPGSGKSTFANFVALCLAGELRGDNQVNLRALTASLPDEEGNAGEEPQPWRHGPLLPVLVTLRDLAATSLPAIGTRATAQHLWHFVKQDLNEAGQGDYAPHLRKALLEQGGLLLLDGLDEVPEAEQRREQVKQVIEDCVSGLPRCRVLVTSRIYAYQNQGWRLRDFAEATLAPFSDGQIRRFIDGWYAHIAGLGRLNQQDAAGRAELLKRAVFSRPTLYELAQRPLLLTLMASLHAWRGGELPEGREQLYADAVELLLNVWEQRRIRRAPDGRPVLDEPSLAEYLRSDRAKVRQVLEKLAFEVHRSQPKETGTADISEDALAGALLRLSTNPKANPGQLIVFLRDRAGLLNSRGVGVYTFPHRSFQEYLAACHLTGGDYPDEVAELARTDPDRWREVALLAGAKAARGFPASVWLLVEALCSADPPTKSAGPLPDTWGAQIAAEALIETSDLTRISPTNQAKLERVGRWLLHSMTDSQLPLTERVLAGDILGRLGDSRPGVGVGTDGTPDIEWFVIPGEIVELKGGAGKAEVPTFEMARYPVTNAQFQAFVEANNGYHDPQWWVAMPPDAANGPRVPAWTEPNRPRETVSWYEAVAFCRWLSARLGREVRLPTEFEWQQAATGGDPTNEYSWGPNWDAGRCNSSESRLNQTTVVGLYANGKSSQGIMDLTGNVWEWCLNKYHNLKHVAVDQSGDYRVLHGGSCHDSSFACRVAFRLNSRPDSRYGDYGFRVVRP